MEINEKLASLFHRKRRWTPTTPTAGTVTPGAELTLQRALALRILEIPVGEFVADASRRELPVDDIGRALLEWNIRDEAVHECALDSLVNAMGYPTTNAQAEEFRNRIMELYNQGEHPLQLARVLETSIFFVILPILRFMGSMSMKTVSADISGDEQVHAATNQLICRAIGATPSKALNRLRREIVAWMVEELRDVDLPEERKQYGSGDFWIRQSDQLFAQGQAPELAQTRRTSVMAFFEINKQNQPSYR